MKSDLGIAPFFRGTMTEERLTVPDPLSPSGLEQFGEVAASHVGSDKIPGLVALVARQDQVHVEALGTLHIGGPPVQRDSLYRIASTTKVVTGAATMALVDEG